MLNETSVSIKIEFSVSFQAKILFLMLSQTYLSIKWECFDCMAMIQNV